MDIDDVHLGDADVGSKEEVVTSTRKIQQLRHQTSFKLNDVEDKDLTEECNELIDVCYHVVYIVCWRAI